MADISRTKSFIWGVADTLRGDYKQHEYGDIVLPFVVLRRLDCVLEPTKDKVLGACEKYNGTNMEATMCKKASGSDFYNLSRFTMTKLVDDAGSIKENLVDYVLGFSENAREIFDYFKFEDTVSSLDDNDLLFQVVENFVKVDLGPDALSNSDMGDIYEWLLRRFSEMSNETAGEHYSPRDGLALAVDIITAEAEEDLTIPGRIISCYDPCCGTGGALSIFEDKVLEYNSQATVNVYGQELNDITYAMCKADILLKGGNPENIRRGNTLNSDQFKGDTFGYIVSNPPYGVDWKKVQSDVLKEAKTQGYSGRFGAGTPRVSDGQLLFLQHMISKMRPREDGGARIAVFMNGSPLFTGGAGSGESEIRRWVLENDLLEAIIAMPNDFFFNTGIATYIWVLNNKKPVYRKGKVQLINANGIYSSMRKNLGSKRCEISEKQRARIVAEYTAFKESDICKIFDTTEFGYTAVTIERPLLDEMGNVETDKKGHPKPDNKLRDTENIPLAQDIDEYFQREVVPYASDAWMNRKKDKVGYEIPFTRYFYQYTPLRTSADILAEIRALEASIADKLQKAQA